MKFWSFTANTPCSQTSNATFSRNLRLFIRLHLGLNTYFLLPFKRKLLLLCVFLLSFATGYSQCVITAKRNACVNDLVSFSINNSSGSSVTAYAWNFGSYGTSSNTNPLVKFTSAGTVTLSCTLTLSGGGTCTDTHTIVINANPKAILQVENGSEFCFNRNRVCVQNNSTPAAAPLASLTLLWGDGGLNTSKAPIPYRYCYTYKDTGVFKLNLEIADSFGCKDVTDLSIRIKPVIKINPNYQVTNYCDSVKICFNDNATGPGTPYTRKWTEDGTGKLLSTANPYCVTVKPGAGLSLKIATTNSEGCTETGSVSLFAPENKIYVSDMGRSYCMNSILTGQVTLFANESVNWSVNGQSYGKSSFLKLTTAKEGWNKITITQTAPCKLSWTDSFRVFSVRAAGKIFNDNRRKIIDTVFFLDLSPRPPGSRLSKTWVFGDAAAPQCTTNIKIPLNFNQNCNYSLDTIGKHYYHKSDCYTARLMVFDTATGCYDDTVFFVFRSDSCDKILSANAICAGDFVDFKIPRAMWFKVFRNNYLYTDLTPPRDSLGLTNVPKRYYYSTPGVKSPILWRYYSHDTIWQQDGLKILYDSLRPGRGWVADTLKNAITVYERPTLKFKASLFKRCNPFTGLVKFTDTIFRNPAELKIDWGDTIIFYPVPKVAEYRLPDIYHEYKKPGRYLVKVSLKNKFNCEANAIDTINAGLQIDFTFNYNCSSPLVCFRDSVIQYEGNQRWVRDTDLGFLIWDFGDGGRDTGFMPCHKYAKAGDYKITISAVDKFGCIQQFDKELSFAKPDAGIKVPPVVYCSEIRQYFDSSRIIGPANIDSIIDYSWDFGDGSKPKTLKNPAHIFPSGGNYIITLTVKTKLGCVDTAKIVMPVIGPQVKALILNDSIGCSPLKVDFGNRSRNAGNYIWEFGDPLNTFISTDKDTSVSFTYARPGTYYAHLTGGDSFYNVTTGSYYYCSVRYPAVNEPQLRIIVLPRAEVDFSGPDTICLSDTALFVNLTKSASGAGFVWDTGDTLMSVADSQSVKRKYTSNGVYKVKLWPDFGTSKGCFDTAEKQIVVVSVQPSFMYDCEDLKGPVIELQNTSDLQADNYRWFIIDPITQTEKTIGLSRNLRYLTQNDTGFRTICLALNTGAYCAERFCRTVELKSGVALANVFTPGTDGFNDTYRVPLYGYEKFDLRIYNRWGERIFHATDPSLEWNGKVQNTGSELPEGTYFYVLRFKEPCSGKLQEVNGSVNLIR